MTRTPNKRLSRLMVAGVLIFGTASWAAPVTSSYEPSGAGRSSRLLLEPATSPVSEPAPALDPGESGAAVLSALSSGTWTRACQVATTLLARQVADLDALGVFGVCSAAAGNRDAASSALNRLRQAESSPYYGLIVGGLLDMMDKAPAKAQTAFKLAEQARPANPLALYFIGEAQHALHHDADAIAAFQGVLKTWPKFAPALVSAARLIAKPNASPAELSSALALAERATQADPENRGYWKFLAGLCKRAGQVDRANAIALQWLNPPSVPR